VAIIALGERPSVLALCGAVLVALSVFALAKPAHTKAADTKRAVIFGMMTGVLIAGYTVFDKLAVGPFDVPPMIQQWGTGLGLTVFLAPFALSRRDEVRRHLRDHRSHVLAIGALVPTAYILVLTAMRFTPISYIAPAREVSILVGTIMGTQLLSEGQSGKRIAAAVTMVIGITAIVLG
jgi:drug/metabolite transporter (DMT)-like permease